MASGLFCDAPREPARGHSRICFKFGPGLKGPHPEFNQPEFNQFDWFNLFNHYVHLISHWSLNKLLADIARIANSSNSAPGQPKSPRAPRAHLATWWCTRPHVVGSWGRERTPEKDQRARCVCAVLVLCLCHYSKMPDPPGRRFN